MPSKRCFVPSLAASESESPGWAPRWVLPIVLEQSRRRDTRASATALEGLA